MKKLASTLTVLFERSKSICLAVALTLLFSVNGFSQDPGGSPDGPPPAVPFNDYYHWILIAIGAIFALFVIRKMQKRTTSQQ